MHTNIRVAFLSDFKMSRDFFSRAIASSSTPIPITVGASTTLENFPANQNHDLELILIDIDERATEALAWMERHQRTAKPTAVALLGRRIDEYVIDQALIAGCKGIIGEDQTLETLCKAIDAIAHGEVWLQGKATQLLLNRLLHEGKHSPQAEYGEQLTKREMQIITLFREHPDYSATGLATKLNVSESTLRNHLTRVYRKLGVPNKSALLSVLLKGHYQNQQL